MFRVLLGETMVNPMSLFLTNLKRPSHISDFAPEAVPKRRHCRSECLGNFLPVVAGRSESQDGAVSIAQLSNDVLQIQSRICLTAPTMVYRTTRQLNRPTGAGSSLRCRRRCP